MAQYDDATNDFINTVSNVKTASTPEEIRAGKIVPVLSLNSELNKKYDRDWWDWEPETLWQMLPKDFGIEVTDEVKGAIQALQVLYNTHFAHEHWHVFEKIGHAFNDNTVLFGVLQPLEMDEVAWTIHVINTIRPKEVYDPEILAYVAGCAKQAGMVYLPTDLYPKGSQEVLDELNNDLILKADVKSNYSRIELFSDNKFQETPLGIQLERLKEVKEYVKKGG